MTIKMTSWNVNGIRAADKKESFWNWFNSCDADIISLQETRAQINEIPKDLYNVKGYNSFFTAAEKKGYSSVASYSRIKPINVFHGFGVPELDKEGRVLRLDYEDFILLNLYFPNSGNRGLKLHKKLNFCNTLSNYAFDLIDQGYNVIIAGDVNIAHEPIDLANPEKHHESSGFLPAERDWLSEFLDAGFVDTFRMFNDEPDNYTWWSYRYHAREKGIGWRLDYFFVNEAFKNRVKSSTIQKNVMGSDHCPITLEIDL